MYQEKFNCFENIESLGGKAWEHAVTLDMLNKTTIKYCSIHCFHYQQMIELFIKHLLETKSEFGAYSRSHKLQKLLEELIANTAFKTAIFDIYCETSTGEKFIVEMQKAKVKYFKERSLFYSTFPIKEQAQKGGWDFNLLPVYFIAILDFHYDEQEEERKFRRDVCLKDQDGAVFYDKLHFKFLQMPLFNKQADELETHFDKWVYFLKHLDTFDHIPSILNEPIFKKGFEIAEISHLQPTQFEAYQKSLVEYWEVKNVMDTSFEEGKVEGKIEGKVEGKIERSIEVAIVLKRQNVAINIIAQSTGLTIKEIEGL